MRINDRERKLWLDNDEGLYRRWQASGKSKTEFIKQNKALVDEVITNVVSGRRRAHYLIYG